MALKLITETHKLKYLKLNWLVDKNINEFSVTDTENFIGLDVKINENYNIKNEYSLIKLFSEIFNYLLTKKNTNIIIPIDLKKDLRLSTSQVSEIIINLTYDTDLNIYLVVDDNDLTLAPRLIDNLSLFLEKNFVDNSIMHMSFERHISYSEELMSPLRDYEVREPTFSVSLLKIIDKLGLEDAEVYKRANIDRRLFSKIRSNSNYQPSKNTAISLAYALRLNLDQTSDLLNKAGYTLTHSSQFDLIVIYFIEREIFDILELNYTLFKITGKIL